MNNPWGKIDLNIYEAHMSSDDVYQLQMLNNITKQQLNDYKYSCVIQKNNDNLFVSKSDLSAAFDPILSIHRDIVPDKLINALNKIGLSYIKGLSYRLPNGKEFFRLDFKKH